jgi:hypothetical protein
MRLGPVEEFQGLMLADCVEWHGSIAAIVGRNGAGKSRLLQAIAENKIGVSQADVTKSLGPVLHLTMDKLQPGLIFGFDSVQHAHDAKLAAALYTANRGKFHAEPQRSIETIGRPGMAASQQRVNIYLVADVVSRAGIALRKDVNQLDEQDVADHFTSAPVTNLGSLNVTAIMLAYWDRLEQNFVNEARNDRHGAGLPHWTHEQFETRFGPPPWGVFNESEIGFGRALPDSRRMSANSTWSGSKHSLAP